MQIRLFTIPISETGASLEEMNRFLRGNKILEVQNQFVNNENGSCWCFCVKYIENIYTPAQTKEKTDYKQILDAAAFKRFSKLREIRKQIASEEAIPAYAIFTDEELAGLAKLAELLPSQMLTVKGIGDKKVEKYAQKIIELMEQYNKDEKNRIPD
ncbi:MAG: HRDC domain-containing protein [Bacteroidetes bacterium]|nr:HRDC domain-containing protein [Bacteroidota bacterium]